MRELGSKGGADNPIFADGRSLTKVESGIGKTMMFGGFKEPKDFD